MQLQIDESSVFSCDHISGVIQPFSTISIAVNFIPQSAIPYCRTVAIIIHNQVINYEAHTDYSYLNGKCFIACTLL